MQDAPTQVVFNYTSIHAAQAAHEHDGAGALYCDDARAGTSRLVI